MPGAGGVARDMAAAREEVRRAEPSRAGARAAVGGSDWHRVRTSFRAGGGRGPGPAWAWGAARPEPGRTRPCEEQWPGRSYEESGPGSSPSPVAAGAFGLSVC